MHIHHQPWCLPEPWLHKHYKKHYNPISGWLCPAVTLAPQLTMHVRKQTSQRHHELMSLQAGCCLSEHSSLIHIELQIEHHSDLILPSHAVHRLPHPTQHTPKPAATEPDSTGWFPALPQPLLQVPIQPSTSFTLLPNADCLMLSSSMSICRVALPGISPTPLLPYACGASKHIGVRRATGCQRRLSFAGWVVSLEWHGMLLYWGTSVIGIGNH